MGLVYIFELDLMIDIFPLLKISCIAHDWDLKKNQPKVRKWIKISIWKMKMSLLPIKGPLWNSVTIWKDTYVIRPKKLASKKFFPDLGRVPLSFRRDYPVNFFPVFIFLFWCDFVFSLCMGVCCTLLNWWFLSQYKSFFLFSRRIFFFPLCGIVLIRMKNLFFVCLSIILDLFRLG